MIGVGMKGACRIWLATSAVDGRKGFDTLAAAEHTASVIRYHQARNVMGRAKPVLRHV